MITISTILARGYARALRMRVSAHKNSTTTSTRIRNRPRFFSFLVLGQEDPSQIFKQGFENQKQEEPCYNPVNDANSRFAEHSCQGHFSD